MMDDLIDKMVEVTRDTWMELVAHHGRRAQWTPKLLLVDDDGTMTILHLEVLGEDEISSAAMVASAAGESVGPSTAWTCAVTDAYASNDVALNEAALAGTTSLRRLYESGHPGVTDALCIFAVNRMGHQQMRVLPYRVRSRRVHWLPLPDLPPDGADKIDGRLASALLGVMTRANN
jgi:hypothetical protein